MERAAVMGHVRKRGDAEEEGVVFAMECIVFGRRRRR